MALSRNLTRGRKNTHIHAACVYLSCRTEGTAHLLIDISDVLQICCYELGRTYLKLSQALCINVPSVDPCLYILRFASKLEFGTKTQQVTNTALRLVQRMKRDSIHSGRRPSGLCGAALLIASRLHEFNRSIGDIVKVVKVHESTMRKRLIEFGDTPSSALTLEEFMTVDLEEEQDPPSFKVARKKDKERLQKLMEEEADTFSDLQKQIECQLDQTKRRVGLPKSLRKLEESEVQKFIHESTMTAINQIIEECEDDPDYVHSGTKELGPNMESIGLPTSLQDTTNAPQTQENEMNIDLNFDDIDDEELDSYIMTEPEFEIKKNLWHEINAEYLQKQKEKEELLKKEKEEGKPEKKPRKRPTKRARIGPANSAGEAIEKIIQEKKISSKINYEVLKNLNTAITTNTNETVKVVDQASIEKPREDFILELVTKKASKSTKSKLKDVGLPFIESEQVKKEQDTKEQQESYVEQEDGEDYFEEDPDKHEEPIGEISVLQMLRQHHENEIGEDGYGYDENYEEDDY
ncbi:hypothetical protein ABEB36_002070 [Hypothenemus hampei]